MSPSSPYTTVTVGSWCAVGKMRGWLLPASSLNDGNRGLSVMVWGAIHHGGGVSWSWCMAPWIGIGTSRSWGIKCCHGRRGCLDVTLCTSKKMSRPIQNVTRLPFWANRMLRSWTGQLESPDMNPIEHVWRSNAVWIRGRKDPSAPPTVNEYAYVNRHSRHSLNIQVCRCTIISKMGHVTCICLTLTITPFSRNHICFHLSASPNCLCCYQWRHWTCAFAA